MIKVNVVKQSRYPVSSRKIKDVVRKTLRENGVVSSVEVTVAVMGKSKVVSLAKEYLKENESEALKHPVLSFPTNEMEGPFVFPPDGLIHLGEVVVNYHMALEEAKKTGKLIDEVVCFLVEHGTLHLIGIHHD